jgi:heme-degrading monooxygenase HmoA
MPLIAATRLRIRSIRFLPGFFVQAFLSQRQARRTAGNLSMASLSDANWTFWTCTAWTDETAMHAYMLAAPHRHAMKKLAHW